jgi:PAS domain S-box-containing protein
MSEPSLGEIERNEAEKKQAILAAIIDSSEDAIISKTLEGYITTWNKAAERTFGYEEKEVIGKHISLLIPADRMNEEDLIISQIRDGQRIQHFQTIRVKKDGSTIPISLTISPIKSLDGTIIGASKIARDISDQVRAEQETKKNLENLELLISIGRTISEKLDLQSILQKLTDITTRLTGAEFGAFFYNMVDSRGESYMLFTLSGAPREAFEKFGMPRNTAVFQMTFNGEGILRSDDIRQDPRYGKNAPHKGMPEGHLPVVSYLAVPVISPSGDVIGGLFFGHSQPRRFSADHEKLLAGIASQAAVAIDNAKLYEEIKTLNSRKDEFIGVAGHELRTPITTIKGYLQLLETQASEGMIKDFTEKALRQVNKLNRLITDLLDITRIQAGKLEYNLVRCSLPDLVKESIETVWQIHTSHVIESRLPDRDLLVIVDSAKIEQVLINFLTNAIKYSPGTNKVFLSVDVEGNRAIVSVRDLGIGIPKQHIPNIFRRYYRVNTTQYVIGGLGIGLYISKEIIDRHNGTIWVESEEGRGSTFYFSLPLAE